MMGTIDAVAWFPVLTLVLGFVAAAANEYLKDRRLAEREREARRVQRREAIYLRRVEFQRATLLELQEAIAKLARMTGAASHQDLMAFRSSGVWGKQQLTEEVNEGILHGQTWVGRLCVRVHDQEVRTFTEAFKKACAEMALARSESQADAAASDMMVSLEVLDQRVGETLRALDYDEDEIVKN